MSRFHFISCTSHFRHFRPADFGYDVCPPKHTGGLRIPNCWVLHYVFSGTGIFRTEEKTYRPRAGDLFIIHPNQQVFYAADERNPWTYAWFDFHCDAMPAAALQRDILTEPRLGHIFRTAYEQSGAYTGVERDAFLYGKLAELFGLLDVLYPETDEPSGSQIIHEAIQYVNSRFTQRITVKDVAEHVHMEYFNFISFFHENVGISPGKYLANLRMGESITQLIHHGKSIREVAEMLEYTDVATFTRAFKRHFGMTPKQYVDQYGANSRRNRK